MRGRQEWTAPAVALVRPAELQFRLAEERPGDSWDSRGQDVTTTRSASTPIYPTGRLTPIPAMRNRGAFNERDAEFASKWIALCWAVSAKPLARRTLRVASVR
jgi:hypothetical protein